MSTNPIWVIARFLEDKKWYKFKATDMFVTTPDLMYWPFRPEGPLDHDPKTEYGIIRKGSTASTNSVQSMVLYYILFMSVESDVDEALRTGKDAAGYRIPNEKRDKNRRSAPFTLPLSQLILKTEIEITKSAAKRSKFHKQSSKSTINQTILDKAIEKSTSTLVKGPTKKQSPISRAEKDPHKGKTSDPINDSVEKGSTPAPTLVPIVQDRELSEVEKLKMEVEKMRREKEAAEKLLQQVTLNKEELVQDISSKLSEQLLSKVKDIVSSNSKAGGPGAVGCTDLKNLRNALDPDKESPVHLSPDMIYMGEDQEPLKRSDALSVQRKVFTFPGRVKDLVNLMYPKTAHLLFSKKNASNTEAILITDDAIACLTNILLSMQWTKHEKPKKPISDPMVKRVVEQYSSYLRAELKRKEQPAEVLKTLREKRTQQRQARKGKKLYIIKNRKRYYLEKKEKKSAEADVSGGPRFI